MADSLRVIALISGGKDSFFSLLHCIQNGHQVVALGNLYPAPPAADAGAAPAPRHPDASNHETESEDEQDLNSFMYQTVGHTVIPLYEQALGIPLYRQPIVGSAVQTGTSYGYADVGSTGRSGSSGDLGSAMEGLEVSGEEADETESLVPLLMRIMAEHPTANALSTGAILSTYQRTRVESVAIRLGLTPLSYLWQYPILPPGTQISLLEDMQAVGLDARIVKVASGGLDESFLWQNVASQRVMRRIEKSMKRFGTDGDGAVLGEGGEFETLVVDGPASLFKGRIEVEEKDRRVVREGGGSAWLKILRASVVMKESEEAVDTQCRTPDLLESRFTHILASLDKDNKDNLSLNFKGSFTISGSPVLNSLKPLAQRLNSNDILHWTVTANHSDANESISTQTSKAIEEIRHRLHQASLQPTDIISTVIILRSIQDFASVNRVYGALFTKPNPPSRVTISCGTLLPRNVSLLIHLSIQNTPSSLTARKALHVQSRSYWAPANIGPYSQATSITLPSTTISQTSTSLVSIAGQIPLIPHTMNLPLSSTTHHTTTTQNKTVQDQREQTEEQDFKLQALLSLQHLLRITREMHISWLSSCVAYLPSSTNTSTSPLTAQKSQILGQAWKLLHQQSSSSSNTPSDDEDAPRDLWEEKHYAGMEIRGGAKDEREYPAWDTVDCSATEENATASPPFWTVEVEELPKGSMVEWAAGWGVVGGPVKVFDISFFSSLVRSRTYSLSIPFTAAS
ncbi:ATP binding L-PSP endoribonuclease family protein-like protein [Rhexocercosporidium sp. MPI-PUGE-AT-0058]|nr:ATP binding L-PSP endoribonuclease family protein-like protein [Rhexocercosporidium sp. MPI-PUGE-AT-0058]